MQEYWGMLIGEIRHVCTVQIHDTLGLCSGPAITAYFVMQHIIYVFNSMNNVLDTSLYFIRIGVMMFYPTIGSTYFVKTQTYVALFCPHELSIIFSGVMYLELSPL